jgi:hypothetical protein
MSPPAYATVYVFDLPITTQRTDVARYFENLLPGCDPDVWELVTEPKTSTKVTTVTFKRKNAKACLIAIDTLKANDSFEVATPFQVSKIGISSSFKGITTLACKVVQPSFEYVNITRPSVF